MRRRFPVLPIVCFILVFLTSMPASAATRQEIENAIKRGVAYLQKQQQEDGSIPEGSRRLGGTALAALALLESNVGVKEPSITKAVSYVRQQCVTSRSTYEVSLCIMLLDKLGDKSDERLIRGLGQRLRDGQAQNGAWTYHVPVEANESQRSNNVIRRRIVAAGGDNSNTQFAVLGLWVVRKHGVEVDEALQKTNEYFRQSVDQKRRFGGNPLTKSGGWSYKGSGPSTPAMTCAGLIALATHFGTSALQAGTVDDLKGIGERDSAAKGDALKDPIVQGALKYLEGVLDADATGPRPVVAARGRHDFYFLWSMERVGVIYGLKNIGKVDWYAWGADRIIPSQRADGGWRQRWGNVAGTSFCLLFLNRSNVAKDLTALVGNGEANLTSGTSIEDLRNRVRAARAAQDSNSLLDQLVRTDSEASQLKMIARLRDEKGAAHTKALAEAIEQLTGEMKEKARGALYKRLLRMTADTLKQELAAGDPETKLAAAKAAGEKRAKEVVPELIALLKNADVVHRRAAHRALRSITNEDFGPKEGASTVEQFVAWQRWSRWAKKNVPSAEDQ